MPDREVKTIKDLIYFQYAKIIAKSVFGQDAKQLSDLLPSLLEKKYLKTLYYCHQCRGTLEWDNEGKGTYRTRP